MSQIELLDTIEKLRKELNEFAKDKPLSDPEVVSLSQKLDYYVFLYQRKLAG